MRVQLHRALSKLGLGSRSQAWEWIRAGEVRVDGRIVTDPLAWIDLDRQQVVRSGQDIPTKEQIVVALHKPRGVVTSRKDERGRSTVYDLLTPGLPWLFPVGRLDADSEGLLLLTNDSSLSTRLTEPERAILKTYHVTIMGRPDARHYIACAMVSSCATGRRVRRAFGCWQRRASAAFWRSC
jgi:23S rRNA pseudouridine2605 synthase